jgi:GNAT superfamily N-acetyltransferase
MNDSHLVDHSIIRSLQPQDIDLLGKLSFPWATLEETIKKWQGYFEEQSKGDRLACIIEYQNAIIGYGSLLRNSEYPQFQNKHIPEVNDVWIDECYRKNGLGARLITHIEKLAKAECYHEIGLGVGLFREYGPAQRLYFQLGYKPDGEGITYKHVTAIPWEKYSLDDDLILWLTKPL